MFAGDESLPKKHLWLENHCCPACGCPVRAGELACSSCGFTLVKAGKTRQVEELASLGNTGDRPDEPLLDKAIMFEIDGLTLPLPSSRQLIVGRTVAGDDAPDIDLIDLGHFNAQEKGVSRRHLCISRDILIYVTDLGSTNGTFLNGQRLTPYQEYPLNNGDNLWLGRLVIKVALRTITS